MLHGDALITEQVAVYLYLADLFPEAGLAPPLWAIRCVAYLRWMVFYAACFEPAVVDRALQREPGGRAGQCRRPGNFDTMLGALVDELARGEWIFGDRFTAADVLWGTALGWSDGIQAGAGAAGDRCVP